MESALSTADVLRLVGHFLPDDCTFYYFHRILEILSIRGFKGIKIDIETLRLERFQGPYSNEVSSLMGHFNLAHIAFLLATKDETIQKLRIYRDFIYSKEFSEDFLIEMNKFLPVNLRMNCNNLGSKFVRHLFASKEFANVYVSIEPNVLKLDEETYRGCLHLLTNRQLNAYLKPRMISIGTLNAVIFFDELLRPRNRMKWNIIGAHCSDFCKTHTVMIALLSQSLETLDQIQSEVEYEWLRTAASDAAQLKLKIQY
jgi:hypothetical protein